MNRPSQRELFAQRPVRSDFARRRGGGGGGFNPRKILLLLALIVLAVGAGIGINTYHSQNNDTIETIPTIKAELPIKERPEQPGGIDIPHRDVEVFQKLDGTVEPTEENGVEHLLPPPDEPRETPTTPVTEGTFAEEETHGQAALPDQKSSEDELPPAVTAAVVEPSVKESVPVKEIAPPPEPKKATVTETVKTVEKPAAVIKKTVTEKTVTKKAETSAKAVDENSQKAASAMARLPKDLFTKDDYKPPVSTPKASGKMASAQFASFTDEAQAKKEVARFQSKYSSMLDGTSLRVVRADLGAKGIYYRIMTISLSEEKAKAICSKVNNLKKGGCIVVR
ncbi:MAG: hypothetical protein AB7E52_03885 [Bdellovibrionales bacterium]